jgi:hypothetical protein
MTSEGKSAKRFAYWKILPFTAGEQHFYLHRGLTGPASLCAACRAASASQHNADSSFAHRSM